METHIKPIKPDEVSGAHRSNIPHAVIETFNDLIVKNFSRRSAIIFQDDIIKLLKKKGLGEKEIFDNRWLDVEDLYEDSGWHVIYDKPAYNESYRANFTFSKK